MGSGGKIAAIFILSLFVSTFLIAYFDTGLNGSTKVNQIDLPMSINGLSITESFEGSNCFVNIAHYNILGTYNCSAGGLDLLTGTIRNKPQVNIDKNGDFKNSYSISYLSGDAYYIIIAQQSFPLPVNLLLKVDSAGLHLPVSYYGVFDTEESDSWFTPIEGASLSDAIIQTDFNGKDNTLSIIFNDQTYNIPTESLPPFYGENINYYEGVMTYGNYELKSLSSNYIPPEGSSLNALSLIVDLAWNMLKLASYSFPYEVIPLELQILLILPQEFLIVVGIAMFVREG
jgi:hypothetical protein